MEFNVYTNFKENINYGFNTHGRIYPFETTLDKLFLDIGMGYRKSKWELDNVHCLVGSFTAGWKFLFDKGFLIEPSLGFWHNIYTFSGETSHNFVPIVGTGIGWSY